MSEPTNNEILVSLTRIETKLDGVVNGVADHENRLRNLERWKYALPTSALVSLGSAIIAVSEVRH